MKRLVAVSIIAMMLFSSCGKSHNLLEPREPIEAKQTELIESHEETKLVEEDNYKVLILVSVAYLVVLPLFAFIKECTLNQRAFRFKNNTSYMLVNPYASPPYHYVEVVNQPDPVISLDIGIKVDEKPVWKEIRGSIPKPK
jgi:hypothetical protein